jgi:anti-sigma factor RsiW
MSTAPEMTCREFVELVTDLIEGQLAEARRLEAEAHLGECDNCATYLEQIELTVAALRRLADSEQFPESRVQALAAFRQLRANGDGAGLH